MMDLGIQHFFSSGVYAKQMHLPAGHFAVSHKHNYDHLSILAQGVAVVRCGAEETQYVAPACITIKAGEHHEIIAIEDTVWFCIHATDETDADKIDEVLIEKE